MVNRLAPALACRIGLVASTRGRLCTIPARKLRPNSAQGSRRQHTLLHQMRRRPFHRNAPEQLTIEVQSRLTAISYRSWGRLGA